MSFPDLGFAATSETVLSFAGGNVPNKKIKISANPLVGSTAIYAEKISNNNNDKQALLLVDNNKSDKFTDDNGNVQLVAMLKLTTSVIDSVHYIGFGQNVSNDNYEAEGAAGWLTFAAGQNPDSGELTAPTNASLIAFDVNVGVANDDLSDFVVKLRDFFPNGGWVSVEVYQMSNGNYAMEGGLIVHLVTEANGYLTPLGIIYDTSKPGNDEGENSIINIQNGAFNLNLDDYPGGVYVYGLIKNNNGTFEIGDPKTDATVSIVEI